MSLSENSENVWNDYDRVIIGYLIDSSYLRAYSFLHFYLIFFLFLKLLILSKQVTHYLFIILKYRNRCSWLVKYNNLYYDTPFTVVPCRDRQQ